MSGSTQTNISLLSIFLPIAVTATALPYNEMTLIPQFNKLRNLPCNPVGPERVQDFFASSGISSTGLFVAIVLGPVVVRSIFRWRDRRRREKEQRLSAAAIIPTPGEQDGKEREPLIYGDNPNYHDNNDSVLMPPPSAPHVRHSGRVRHLRIHSLDELPPPTMDDISRKSLSWSCPVSPVLESAPPPPTKKTGKRRSPFNPVVPGMKTTWEEGVDPTTGRRWKRKLVVYTSLEILDGTLDEEKIEGIGFQGNDPALK